MKKTKLLTPIIGVSALATVIVPVVTTTSCSKGISANEADKKFLNTINEYMAYNDTQISTYKAVTSLKDLGYDVTGFQLSNSSLEFAFDMQAKRFIIMNNDAIVASPENYKMNNKQLVFKFTSKYNKDSKYGQYLLDNYSWSTPTEAFVINTSIDVGNNENIKYITYTKSENADTNRELFFRTHSELLDIHAAGDTIFHMGVANNINVYGDTKQCTYTEAGRVSYLYVKDVKINAIVDKKADSAQIDVLESDGNVTAGDDFNVLSVNMLVGSEIEGQTYLTPKKIKNVATEAELKAALADATVEFIRINADEIELTEKITINGVSKVIDLSGNLLIDNITTAGVTSAIEVTNSGSTADGELTLMDSYREGGIVLYDHYISVKGGTSVQGKEAILKLEGADIYYVAETERTGAVHVGDTEANGTTQNSSVYMFGGKITCIAEQIFTTFDTYPCGIYLTNNAYVQIVYGAIYSDYMCVRTNGQYDNTYIDIVSGTFSSDEEEGMCIYHPSSGKLEISGGNFTGNCIIGARGGNINITGGYLHATGDDKTLTDPTDAHGISVDGSVICFELGGNTAYGHQLSLTVGNATLQSDNSFIVNIYHSGSGTSGSEFSKSDDLLEIDFFSGIYYYAKDNGLFAEYDGVRIANTAKIASPDSLTKHCRINQYGGTWIKVEE